MMRHLATALSQNLIKLIKFFIILNVISPRPVGGHSTEGPYVGISQEEIAKFFTETRIVSEGQKQERCSETVIQRRQEAIPTLGVESSVTQIHWTGLSPLNNFYFFYQRSVLEQLC